MNDILQYEKPKKSLDSTEKEKRNKSVETFVKFKEAPNDDVAGRCSRIGGKNKVWPHKSLIPVDNTVGLIMSYEDGSK